ncbi:hypothetical protein M2341_002685 [Sphingobium sp. B7D2B]|uniref:DUF2807 domain-containing protein n=1 Tax=Sphingobium sp. B7D2B TaxID=2940583 RepID=UPI002225B538|nr:DUF2807 domain-containing protein [Sphingobium sp. B7D2B]MCW2367238.1 hypothetical protein [Sphingobium sp. B7D2B]
MTSGAARRTIRLLMLVAAAGGLSAANAANRTYIVTDFDSIRVEGPLEVSLETGRGASARGEGDRATLDALQLTVSARTLTVRLRAPGAGAAGARGDRGTARLALTAPSLRRVQLVGSGLLRVKGLNKAAADVNLVGSGRIEVRGIELDDLKLVQGGAGSTLLSGQARKVQIGLSGSGTLDASDLRAVDLDLAVDGAATAEAFAERTAKVMLVGTGSAVVEGRPACTVRQVGSGLVRCGRPAP